MLSLTGDGGKCPCSVYLGGAYIAGRWGLSRGGEDLYQTGGTHSVKTTLRDRFKRPRLFKECK